jgi:anhydro-N-acetylmuramic acid kinase
MIYRVIGVMSGSSLDGLDIAFTEFTETGGKWTFDILNTDCIEYTNEWCEQLSKATMLPGIEYQLLHSAYGHYIGEQINQFIKVHRLQHKVHLIASHGHTTFHLPEKKMTAQLGDGAAIAAATSLPVVSDLRALDIALGGQGAPIVPIGEKLLFSRYDYFLNLGGIANISINNDGKYIAFDICAANRVLNMLAEETGAKYDEGGKIAAFGKIDAVLLKQLNELEYYGKPYPKSLSNSFGTDIIYPMIKNRSVDIRDVLRTYTEHICQQITNSIRNNNLQTINQKLLVTGGGAFNTFLIQRLSALLNETNIEVIVPDEKIVLYKEAMIMGLIGILRWREEANVLPSVTGASKASIGGALWLGGDT